MDTKKIILLFIIPILLVGMVGCTQAEPSPEATQSVIVSEEPEPTPTQQLAPTDPPEPTQEPTDIPTESPTDEPEAEPVADGIDYCVACHTDQQMLTDTAKPIVAVESENEGAG